MKYSLGRDNPFRYRSYYYDVESGLFYVGSRYYDPEIGRFINADVPEILMLSGLTGDILGANLFAYCANNPVMNVDPSGYIYIRFADLWKVIAIIGLNPVGATLIGLGVYKLSVFLAAKAALLGAKIGALLGPVGSFAFSVLLGVIGFSVGKKLAIALIDAIAQKKGGIDIGFKYTFWGWQSSPN